MKKILLLSSVLTVTALFSQTGPLFPDSNCVWSVSDQKIFVKGDTILNGKNYKKYYSTPDSFLVNNISLAALLRQDATQKKIFKYNFLSNSEELLYNFNLADGDTAAPLTLSLNQYGKVKITRDSVLLLPGQYRKRWKFVSIEPFTYPFLNWIIEGIGSPNGPLKSGFQLWYSFDIIEGDILVCQQVNGVRTFALPNVLNCYMNKPVSISEQSGNLYYLKISPNPASDKISIEYSFGSNITKGEIVITDFEGRSIMSYKVENTIGQLELATLPSGLYFCNLKRDGELLKADKIVVIH